MEKEKDALIIQDCIPVYKNAFVEFNDSKNIEDCQEENKNSYRIDNVG